MSVIVSVSVMRAMSVSEWLGEQQHVCCWCCGVHTYCSLLTDMRTNTLNHLIIHLSRSANHNAPNDIDHFYQPTKILTSLSVKKHFLFIAETMIWLAPSSMNNSMARSLAFVRFEIARIALHWMPLWVANSCGEKTQMRVGQ